jgi:hypothetical protein
MEFVCKCGHDFFSGPLPGPPLWAAIGADDLESFVSAVTEAEQLLKRGSPQDLDKANYLSQVARDLRTAFYQCPKCRRLLWYRDPNGPCEVYAPEN